MPSGRMNLLKVLSIDVAFRRLSVRQLSLICLIISGAKSGFRRSASKRVCAWAYSSKTRRKSLADWLVLVCISNRRKEWFSSVRKNLSDLVIDATACSTSAFPSLVFRCPVEKEDCASLLIFSSSSVPSVHGSSVTSGMA